MFAFLLMCLILAYPGSIIGLHVIFTIIVQVSIIPDTEMLHDLKEFREDALIW